MTVTVWVGPGCPRCDETVGRMRLAGLDPVVRGAGDPRERERVRALARELGSRWLPLVDAAGRRWAGWRPDLIERAAGERRDPPRPPAPSADRRRM